MLFFAVVGLLFGFSRGGSFSNINKNIPKELQLPVLAFATEFLASRFYYIPEWIQLNIVYMLLFWFVACNIRKGAWVVWFGCGTLMNYLVISVNGFRMPVSTSLLKNIANQNTIDALVNGEIYAYVLADSSTKLLFLGDIIAIPLLGELVGFASLGDLVIGIGIGILAYRMVNPIMNND
jgi:hypothetical protein